MRRLRVRVKENKRDSRGYSQVKSESREDVERVEEGERVECGEWGRVATG